MDLRKYSVRHKFKENIEAEEIFLDAEAIKSLENKGKLERPIRQHNFIFLYLLILLVLIGFFGRTAYLQIAKGAYYHDLAKGTRLRVYPLTAPRGVIYDRFYERLVYNVPSFDLIIDLADFQSSSAVDQDVILRQVAAVASAQDESGSLADDYRKRIESASGRTSRVTLVANIERAQALVLEVVVDDWPGVRLEKNVRRQYVDGPACAHILGYTGQVSQDDLKFRSDYLSIDQIGKSGLEYQYENILRGEHGQEQMQIDSLGRFQNLLARKESQSGSSLLLSLDGGLQRKFYEALENIMAQLRSHGVITSKGVGVAVDPRDGGVLALVNLPSFDSNLFAQGISQEDFQELNERADQPFLSRAVVGQYPSGSIIKPLIAAAALEEKLIRPSQTVDCRGVIDVVNQYDPSIVYHFVDWAAHGSTGILSAIARSCNVFFYALGGGYGDIEGLGAARIKQYLQDFGLGSPTGIDLPYEETGLIPDPAWKEERGESWRLGDTYHLSIGQGELLVTPIQMAMAVAAVANEGSLYRPQLVDKIVDADRNVIEDLPPELVNSSLVRPEYLRVVKRGMRETVVSGSAQMLADLPVKAAGKTGTAQFGDGSETHAWFVGFAPYREPTIAIVILIEGGGEGHDVAVPVAKEVLQWYFTQEDG